MERDLNQTLDNVMRKPGVVGVVCADKHGLCLSAKGVGRGDMSGVLANISEVARKLGPDSESEVSPTIRLESEDQGYYCLVQKRKDFTLGIFKSNTTQ